MPLVLVGIEDAVDLPDSSAEVVLQVPLDEVLSAAKSERPASIVLVASADHLSDTCVVTRIGGEVGIDTTVLAPDMAVALELARAAAPAPPELVTLPSAGDRRTIGLATLRQDLRDQLGTSVPVARRQDAELCLTEMFTNAARHGVGEPTATVGWSLGRFRVTVHDESDEWPSPGVPTQRGGRGLRLIHALAAAWGVYATPEQGGKDVWFELEALPVPEVSLPH